MNIFHNTARSINENLSVKNVFFILLFRYRIKFNFSENKTIAIALRAVSFLLRIKYMHLFPVTLLHIMYSHKWCLFTCVFATSMFAFPLRIHYFAQTKPQMFHTNCHNTSQSIYVYMSLRCCCIFN